MRALIAFVVGLVLLAIAVLGVEMWTRKVVDERVQVTVEGYLTRVSSDGQGFDRVVARHFGWALPDLYRGSLRRVDAVAVGGELAGLPVERLTLSARPVDIAEQQAGTVEATATLGLQAVAGLVEASSGLSGATVTMLASDMIQVTAPLPAQGVEILIALRVTAEGGGVRATAVSATIGGLALDPATVLSGPLTVLPVSSLPAGLLATGVEVSPGPGGTGAVVELRFACNSCRLG